MIKLNKVARAANLPENATEKEIDQRLNEMIAANVAALEADDDDNDDAAEAAATDQGAAAGATQETPEQATEQAATPTISTETSQLATALDSINTTLADIKTRLDKVEGAEAAKDTGGATDAPVIEAKKSWMNDPINVRAQKRFQK